MTKLKIKLFIYGGIISAIWLFFLVVAAMYIAASLTASIGGALGVDNNGNYTNTWGQYRSTVYKYAEEYGVSEYSEIFLAQVRFHIPDSNTDVMCSSLKEYNTEYPKTAGGITDPEYSIRTGIREMAYLLDYTGCTGISDEEHLELALMGYALGRQYIDFANLHGGHTRESAAEFMTVNSISANAGYGKIVMAYSQSLGGGEYIFPFTDGYINSHFGYRTDPFTGETSYHSGIDIPKPEGTPIMACSSGVVTEVSYTSVRGWYVVIDHPDGIRTLYQHLQTGSIKVSTGQTVTQGEVIAGVGSTGRSTGPHLHLCLYINGVLSDPEQYIREP